MFFYPKKQKKQKKKKKGTALDAMWTDEELYFRGGEGCLVKPSYEQ